MTSNLLEFMKAFAQMMQEPQATMLEQKNQMTVIKENLDKLPPMLTKIKSMLPETLNLFGMEEAVLNDVNAEPKKTQFKTPPVKNPPTPTQVSLDASIPAQPKATGTPAAPDVGALLAQIAQFQQAVQAMTVQQKGQTQQHQ